MPHRSNSKEAVVGTLDATYSALGEADQEIAARAEEGSDYDLSAGLEAAIATIPANLVDALGGWTDPLGLSIGDVSNAEAAAEAQAVMTATFGAMAERFDGTAGAFAYLLFILMYSPCVAAIAAIHRETSPGWTLFAVAWTTGLGYLSATIFYQAAIFQRDPVSSGAWIAGMLALLAVTVMGLRWWSRREPNVGALARDAA
ncbi:hypothetical protein [Thiorhodococcus mannitoliphagus]|uniref:hypothetical protein n=1 Tax=Thiorhodococcus mannitoliphagus TaxID=329406 RepID=UPI0030B8D41D